MKHNPTILSGLLVLIACMGIAQPLSAAVVTRVEFHHGTANCQAALPVFDGNIRKRPMGIANEGSNNAFITCDFERDIASSDSATSVSGSSIVLVRAAALSTARW